MSLASEAAYDRVLDELQNAGQEHAARWLEQLDGRPRQKLLRQLADLDFDQLREFRRLLKEPPAEVDFGQVEPAPIERLPQNEAQAQAEDQVLQMGTDALEADRVAAVTAAGGQGTRLRYDHPKGMYPITPIRRASLFQSFAEQILAARRRYGCRLPWLIMTSPTNDAETRDFFARNRFFALGEDSVHFFEQKVSPIVDSDGRLLRAEVNELLVGPGGHGGTFDALASGGLVDMLEGAGLDLISYFQVDNPLVTVADPRFIGHHVRKGADFSCKVVAKRNPEEGLGIAVRRGGKPAVIEYVEVPDEVASARTPDGELRYLYGSIAIHVIDVPFVRRVAQEDALPWHIARKQYEIVDDEGQKTRSAPGGCCKFERFIFEALPMARECAFVEVRRESEFAPVKNAKGKDSPESARRLMQQRWLDWLCAAGASFQPPSDLGSAVIEISPLYAADAEELKERVEPGWQPSFPLLLEP